MRVIVIGLGSMGKRRIRLIKELFPKYEVIGIDFREDRRVEAQQQLGIKPLESVDQVEGKVDCAFICTAPLTHASIIRDCLQCGWNVFTEMNLVTDGYEDNIKLAEEKGCVLFLSSTFLYREEISYIRKKITADRKWNYIYHIGQYLPDWHPWESYKDYFIGDRRTNGCREIMAIELPWIIAAFGGFENYHVISDKMTDLTIDYHDNFMIQINHKNGCKGTLIVDVVSPCAVRKLEVYAEGQYFSWDGIPESLREYDPTNGNSSAVSLREKTEHMEGYRAFVVENAYKNEIKEFFDVVSKKRDPIYGFAQDRIVLELIDKFGA